MTLTLIDQDAPTKIAAAYAAAWADARAAADAAHAAAWADADAAARVYSEHTHHGNGAPL